MKKIYLTSVLLFISLIVSAQGIKFETDIKKVFADAKASDKLIFIDFYTSWCAPCKILSAKVFPEQKVGELFNSNFVNLKLDAEKEGADLAKKYSVNAYPTMVFIDAEGTLFDKATGAISAEELISVANRALTSIKNPMSYANLKKEYEIRKDDAQFLLTYLDVMNQYKEVKVDQVEHFLKIQRLFPEKHTKMMEFFLKYEDILICGGEAERIFNANFNEYMQIATQSEERRLLDLKTKMIQNSGKYAISTKNATLYETFIDRWRKLDEKPRYQNIRSLNLELYKLQNNKELYISMAFKYLDSLTTSRAIENIRQEDSLYYEHAKIEIPRKYLLPMMASAMLDASKNLDATIYANEIIKVSKQLLQYPLKGEERKRINGFVDFAGLLNPQAKGLTELKEKLKQE